MLLTTTTVWPILFKVSQTKLDKSSNSNTKQLTMETMRLLHMGILHHQAMPIDKSKQQAIPSSSLELKISRKTRATTTISIILLVLKVKSNNMNVIATRKTLQHLLIKPINCNKMVFYLTEILTIGLSNRVSYQIRVMNNKITMFNFPKVEQCFTQAVRVFYQHNNNSSNSNNYSNNNSNCMAIADMIVQGVKTNYTQ